MFNENLEKFSPDTQINLVEFPKGVDAEAFFEKTFSGTIQQQLRDALSYIKSRINISKTIETLEIKYGIRLFITPDRTKFWKIQKKLN